MAQRPPHSEEYAKHGAHDAADEQQTQRDAHPTAHFFIDAFAVDGEAEIAVHEATNPRYIPLENRGLIVLVDFIQLLIDRRLRDGRVFLQVVVARVHGE